MKMPFDPLVEVVLNPQVHHCEIELGVGIITGVRTTGRLSALKYETWAIRLKVNVSLLLPRRDMDARKFSISGMGNKRWSFILTEDKDAVPSCFSE